MFTRKFVQKTLGAVVFNISISLIFVASALGQQDQKSENLDWTTLLKDGKAYISERYRFEYVDQVGLTRVAKASTLRTRLGFQSGVVSGFSGKLELEDVSEIGNDSYNNTINGETDYPVVADPDGTELNEVYLNFEPISKTSIRYGREGLKLDNLRFVGDVGWRQNNQTFDGAQVTSQAVENFTLWYGFIHNVNRIFGEDSEVGDFDTRLNLFNIRYTGIKDTTAVIYTYLFDVESDEKLSNANFGSLLSGSHPIQEKLSLLYDAEFAYQTDYRDNPVDYSAPYWRVGTGVKAAPATFKIGYESLGSDDGKQAVITPFATLHAWNGWADKFLTTPERGLNDAFSSLRFAWQDICPHFQELAFETVYHYYSSDSGGSQKLGDEWDAEISSKFAGFLWAGVKYANYNAANFATDTEKLIFSLGLELKQ